jgi:putative membrane protein
VHIFVALDWVQTRRTRRLMETICSLAIWPITLREERLVEDTTTRHTQHHSAYARSEIKRYFLRAATQSVRLLRRNKVLVIFPEAYPNIDPAFTPKTAQTPFLPFKPGFIRLVEMAERDKKTRVAIIPAGFTYQAEQKKWRVTLRLGASIYRQNCPNNEELLHTIETQMQALSRPCPNERV